MPLDCTTCGTCCFSHLATYVAVTGADHARLGAHTDLYVEFDGNRAFMRMAAGRCSALKIEGQRFLCAVYAERPETCRTLLRNSGECGGEIGTKSERPLTALRLRSVPETPYC